MPDTPCKQKTMEVEVREGSPGDVEGPQGRNHTVASGCEERARGHSLNRQAGSQKRGTPLGGEGLAEGHSAKVKLMPRYEPVLSENGWVYPDGRTALTARETRKKLPEKTLQRNPSEKEQESKEFVIVKRGRKSGTKKDHKKREGTEIQNKYGPLQEEDEREYGRCGIGNVLDRPVGG